MKKKIMCEKKSLLKRKMGTLMLQLCINIYFLLNIEFLLT